ncbi:maleylpyruvate isomerase N-terminal domain-containing protein [Pseudonocardia sp. KRD291]|uniref:maleylpyruvate isomerase N-terminal domain-containing protein n=1 Tax=Pseudonocardia sp. KRD291 TaxID=2792007 RepID=UPI001C4A5141|nr:maleylpyruvate isomerase N-terminal domain-containing protein [Pseudonocardia sp. KRD291]MBW0106331.1 maleylpyruvate isomerase N-terminal domain-containing protein [Pseudonocardia sp. KRD291]
MATTPDDLPAYADAADTVAGLVGRIGGARWSAPGLGHWSLRDLVGHTGLALSNVLTYADAPSPTEDIVSAEAYYTLPASRTGEGADDAAVDRRAREAGEALGADPATAFAALADRAVARVRDIDPDTLVRCVAGGVRIGAYAATRTAELVLHGHDVAAAVGEPVAFTDRALASTATVLARTAVARGTGRELVLALGGRGRLPDGYCVV